jgi:hypothetical protein
MFGLIKKENMKKIMLVYLLSLSAFVQTASFKAQMRQAQLASQVDQLLLLLRNIASENLDRNFQAPEHSRAQQPQMHQGGGGGGGAKEDDAERAQRLGFDADELRGYGLDEESINQQRDQFLRKHKRQQEQKQERQRQEEEARQQQEQKEEAKRAARMIRNMYFKTMNGANVQLQKFDLSLGFKALLVEALKQAGFRDGKIVYGGEIVSESNFDWYVDIQLKSEHSGNIIQILNQEEQDLLDRESKARQEERRQRAEEKRQQEQERQRQRQEEDRQRQEAEAQARAAQEKVQRERAAQQQAAAEPVAKGSSIPVDVTKDFSLLNNKNMRIGWESVSNMTKKRALEIFGLSETATKKDIKKAYRKLSLIFHPDKNVKKSDKENKIIGEQFKLVNAVNEFLNNISDAHWQNYDNLLQQNYPDYY